MAFVIALTKASVLEFNYNGSCVKVRFSFFSQQQNILRLQITVDDVFRMEVLESKNDLGGVEPRHVVWEPL